MKKIKQNAISLFFSILVSKIGDFFSLHRAVTIRYEACAFEFNFLHQLKIRYDLVATNKARISLRIHNERLVYISVLQHNNQRLVIHR